MNPIYAIMTRDMEERNIHDSAAVHGPFLTFEEACNRALALLWETLDDATHAPSFDDLFHGEPDGHKVLAIPNGDVVEHYDAFLTTSEREGKSLLIHDEDAVDIWQIEEMCK